MSWGVATRNAVGLGLGGIVSLVSRAVQQAVAVVDPFFNYVTLLLPGSGTNGAQNNTFVDSSTNAFTITRNGNTTQGTFSPFSQTGWGAYFDGSGDYLTLSGNPTLTTNFTIEFWFYMPSWGDRVFLSQGGGAANFNTSNGLAFQIYSTATTLWVQWSNGGGSFDTLSAATSGIALNAWHHVAIGNDGTTTRLWIDGASADSDAGTPTWGYPTTRSTYIGYISYASAYVGLGYISNVRTVGSDVYGASNTSITVPTAPLTAISGTSLLTCQSNRFIDNSSNAFAITVNGDTSIQAFSPFNPTAAWNAATNGGSGYFDGSGDYLSVASDAAFGYGTGDFTIEFWVYRLTDPLTSQVYFDQRITATTIAPMIFTDGGNLYYRVGASNVISGSIYGKYLSQWTHIAVARSSGSTKLFFNGAQLGSTYTDTNNYVTSPVLINSLFSPSLTTNSYFSGLRIVKGTALYTAAFTPPTAPPTAVSGTELLCNFTNAGIYDATAKNDLETVGNAQISTTQSQWGGSSMYFDGAGDSLVCPFADRLTFGTGDFTIEYWIRTSATAASLLNPSTTGSGYWSNFINTSTFWWQNSNQTANLKSTSATPIIDGNWHHVAIVRYSGTMNFYFDGVVQGSGTADSTNYSGTAGTLRIGGSGGYISDLNGYIQDLRITKGYARYTTGFTPPTAAFPLT